MPSVSAAFPLPVRTPKLTIRPFFRLPSMQHPRRFEQLLASPLLEQHAVRRSKTDSTRANRTAPLAYIHANRTFSFLVGTSNVTVSLPSCFFVSTLKLTNSSCCPVLPPTWNEQRVCRRVVSPSGFSFFPTFLSELASFSSSSARPTSK